MEGGQWTDQKLEWTPFQSLRCRSREHESRGRESPRKTSMSSEPRSDAKACNAIKDNKRAQAHSDRCRLRIEECLRNTPHGAERLDRRNEVINEALADEVRRGEQRKNRSDGTTVAAPGTEPAAASATTAAAAAATGPHSSPAAGPVRENPTEPDVCDQGQQKSTSTLRSLQKANRRMPQNHSSWSRKVGSKK